MNRETLTAMLNEQLTSTQIDDIYKHLTHLPQIEFQFKIRGFWSTREETRHLPASVYADQEYTLQITLKRLNRVHVRFFRSNRQKQLNRFVFSSREMTIVS